MASLKLTKLDGSTGAAVKLNDTLFNADPNPTLVHQVAVDLMNAKRQGNAETKTRKQVRGGGAKPFRQKGTGRARQGSSREPHMKGGGTVFGPHKRSYRQRTPLKMKRKALCCVLTDRVQNDQCSILEKLALDTPKTKPMAELFTTLSPQGHKTLLVTAQTETNAVRSAENITRLTVRTASDLNALDVLGAKKIIIVKDALKALEERLT